MTLRTRITIGFVLLLAIVQGIAFVFVNGANRSTAETRIAHDLGAGERVFQRLVAHQSSELTQAALLLAADFGFREAVATHDLATIESVLANHGERVRASVMTLITPGEIVLADTQHRDAVDRPFPFHGMIEGARGQGSASAIVMLDGRPHHLVVVPVLAPRLIAWVAIGFVVDDRMARDLRTLTDLEVTFLGAQTGGGWQAFASTLPSPVLAQLLQTFPIQRRGATVPDSGLLAAYVGRAVTLEADRAGTVVVVLQRSLSDVLPGFERLRSFLVILALGSIAVSVLASVLIARGITRPLLRLTDSATSMREGDYSAALDVERGDEIGVLARSLNHMREGISAREHEILRLAYEDGLTALPNRARFNAMLTDAVETARQRNGRCAVVILGLDRFKGINETLGHESGDRVLCEVGARLRAACRATDGVARLGGDEYALLLPDVDAASVEGIVAQMQQALEPPVKIDDYMVDAHASFGIALFPEHGAAAGILMQHADVALYAAKKASLGSAFYDPSHDTSREDHLSLLGELRGAVERDELRIHYQPKVDLRSGKTTAVEALVRWQHPTRGFIPPGHFIPFAEQTGYIRFLTRWVLNAAIVQCRQWQLKGLPLQVAVNLSARELADPLLVDMVTNKLGRNGLSAEWLCLEVTESGVMDDPTEALETLMRLDDLGVKLSVDDFGTGYSSLAYLKKLPVDELKIDRSFVMHMATDPDDLAIVRSTVDLAHNLGLAVVAEGAEDAASVDLLRSLGCDKVQGWFYAKAMPADALEKWLRESPHGHAAVAVAEPVESQPS